MVSETRKCHGANALIFSLHWCFLYFSFSALYTCCVRRIARNHVPKSSVFWDITPCKLLNVNRRFGETRHLRLQGRRIILARNQREVCGEEISVICSSETSVEIQRTTWRYIAEDGTYITTGERTANIKIHVPFTSDWGQWTASVVQWSEFVATDPEVRVRFPALPDFLSSGSGTGFIHPREDNWGTTWTKQ
jgi:hypothetical protein